MFITYFVGNGETIDDISRKFNVSSESILKANNLKSNNLVNIKQLKIPVKNPNFNYYQTRSGDTLYEIARKNNVDLELLALVNGLLSYDYLYPGQIIMVPKKDVKFYMTKANDTLQDISYKTKNNIQNIIMMNPNLYLLEEQLIAYRD